MDRCDEVLRREAPRSSQIWEEQPRSGGLDQSISSANTSSSVPSNQAGTRSVGVSAVASRALAVDYAEQAAPHQKPRAVATKAGGTLPSPSIQDRKSTRLNSH